MFQIQKCLVNISLKLEISFEINFFFNRKTNYRNREKNVEDTNIFLKIEMLS